MSLITPKSVFFHFEESEMEYNNVELNESESIIWALNVTKREHWFLEEIHYLNWIHKKRILQIHWFLDKNIDIILSICLESDLFEFLFI